MNLQNLVDYYSWDGTDLFEDCTTPDPIDITTVKSYIMIRCGLLEPIYHEPSVFKAVVKMWFTSHQWTFDHLVNVLEAVYSPIENVYEEDHYEIDHTGTDISADSGRNVNTLSGSDTLTHSGESTDTLSGSDRVSESGSNVVEGSKTGTTSEDEVDSVTLTKDIGVINSGSDITTGNTSETSSGSVGEVDGSNGSITEHLVSAFNSSGYQSDSKDVSHLDKTTTNSETKTGTSSETLAHDLTTTTQETDVTSTEIERSGTSSETSEESTTFQKTDTTTYGKVDSFEDSSSDITAYGKVDTLNFNKTNEYTHGHVETYDRLRHGNIGVTTNNQLINQELEMLKDFNSVYDYIAAMFERDNMISIY